MCPQRCGYDLRTKFVGVWTHATKLINFSHKSRRTLYITQRRSLSVSVYGAKFRNKTTSFISLQCNVLFAGDFVFIISPAPLLLAQIIQRKNQK